MRRPDDLLTFVKRRGYIAVAALLVGTIGTAHAQTVRVQAEDFVSYGTGGALSPQGGSSGIGIATRDAVGKDGEHVNGSFLEYFRNLGNNSLQEYLEYNVAVPADGMYSITVRAAYSAGSATLRSWNLTNGTTYDNVVNVNPSNGLTAEYMIQIPLTYQMPMLQGVNRVRFYIINRGLNPDWFEFTREGDITMFGLVKGKVTDAGTGMPFGPAMVNAAVAEPGVPADYGFRSVSDAEGNYQLMLPQGFIDYALKVGAQNYSDPLSTVATVTVSDGTVQTQNLSVSPNGRYEGEWFTDAATSGVPNGKGFGMFDRPAGGTSWGRVIGAWESYADWLEYTVTVPSDGLYDVTFYLSPNAVSYIRMTTSTGYENRMSIPKVAYGANVFAAVPLKAGANTIRMTNLGPISTNIDYFTVSARTGAFATVSGMVTNGATSAPEPGATVTLYTDFGTTVVGRAVTDATGMYTIRVAPEMYDVVTSKSGFGEVTESFVTTTANATTTLNATLTPSDTIVILPEQVTDIKNGSNGIPRIYNPYAGSPTGQTLGSLEVDSWAEFPIYVAKPGLYTISFDYGFVAGGRAMVADVRAEGSTQHYATPSVIVAETQAWNVFTVGDFPGTVPLQAGRSVLRIHNVTTQRDPYPVRNTSMAGGSINIARLTLNRTADLPAMAPLTGTVNSPDLGVPVWDAMVMANPQDAEEPVLEPSRVWFEGYWTTTNEQGQYEMNVPLGTYSVRAGRPDNFVLGGALAENVAVTGSGASANLDLQSLWTDNGIRVEAEYYVGKSPEELGDSSSTGIPFWVNPAASNGFKLMLSSEDYIDLIVDVPASRAGVYSVTPVYYNPLTDPNKAGNPQSQYLFVNDRELLSESLPITPSLADKPEPSLFTFADTVVLNPGRNTIRWMARLPTNTTPSFDALQFAPVQTLGMARQALAIAGGLSEATSNDLSSLNVVTDGDSATVIDLADAVELARQGK